MEIGNALPQKARTGLADAIEKHFDRGSSASVVFSKERTGIHVDCHVHLDSGAEIQAEGKGGDAYVALDQMLKHVEAQARRYTKRLKNHHEKTKTPKGAV